MTTPFDQMLDAIDAEVGKWHPTLPHRPDADEREIRHTFTDWFAGWDAATEVAARIVAERAATAPTDEALVEIHQEALREASRRFMDDGGTFTALIDNTEVALAGIRAVRDALMGRKTP